MDLLKLLDIFLNAALVELGAHGSAVSSPSGSDLTICGAFWVKKQMFLVTAILHIPLTKLLPPLFYTECNLRPESD